MTRRLVLTCILVSGICCAASSAIAQPGDYPSKPIRILVGFAAGGPNDIVARIFAEGLGKAFGQPVIVENKPGANALIAAEAVARAKPDGYTLMMTASNHSINGAFYKNQRFDTVNGFTAIAKVAVAPTVLVVNSKFGASSYSEFVNLLKSQPGKYTYASTGNGSVPQLAAEMFKQATGTNIVHVPYKGSAPALMDVISGQADMWFASMGSVLPQIHGGQLIAIAVASPKRTRLLPEAPTFEEAGLKNYEISTWNGFFGPAGLPPAVVQRLSAAIRSIVITDAYREKLAGAGLEPVVDSNPAQFDEQVHGEIRMFEKLIKDTNLTIE